MRVSALGLSRACVEYGQNIADLGKRTYLLAMTWVGEEGVYARGKSVLRSRDASRRPALI